MKYLSIIFIVFLIGCKEPEVTKPNPKPQVRRELKEWPQKCDMCGAEWLITPVKDPDKIIPPTTEWCFNDGHYCEVGFQLILKKNHVLVAEYNEVEREFLNHCLKCQGCRCAAFEPEEWKEITDTIKKIRNEQNQNSI